MYFGADPIDPRTRESETLCDLILNIDDDARLRPEASRNRGRECAGTHWSRILSYDLEAANDPRSHAPAALLAEGDPDDDAGRRARKYLVVAAVIMFSVYMVAYLAVAGVLLALDSPNAIGALVPDTAASAAAGEPSGAALDANARDTRPDARPLAALAEANGLAAAPGGTDSARECAIGSGIATRCVFN